MAFKTIHEAPEAEVARLAAAPAGSRNHTLAALPVNLHGVLEHRIIELPIATMNDHAVVVVPLTRYVALSDTGERPVKRHRGSWRCVVIASDHPSYPAGAGGWHIDIPEAQLVRGRERVLAPAID